MKTHCKRGHLFDEENTYTNPTSGKRVCKICRRNYKSSSKPKIYNKQYYLKNKTKINEYRLVNRDKWKAYLKNYDLIKKYGITTEQVEFILENQKGLCAICSNPSQNGKRLYVDHNHTTNKVRELLCQHCNTGLGMFFENIEILKKAVLYLEKHAESEALCLV